MGVVIFTRDATPYRVGEYVEMYSFDYPPTAPDVTYILHEDRFTEKNAQEWAEYIPYRLIIVTTKDLTLKGDDERVFADRTLGGRKVSYKRNIEALFKWTDRLRILRYIAGVPLPLIGAFLKRNRQNDIETARRLAQVKFHLPDEYAHAVLAFSIEPTQGKVIWPTKRSDSKDDLLPFARTTDLYAKPLLDSAPEIRNMMRDQGVAVKGMKKTKEGVNEWL